MEQIKLTQIQVISSASSATSGSSDSPVLVLACVNEGLIANEVLGIRLGHHKVL